MALIQCPDCGQAVSSTALQCPNCAARIAPLARRRTNPWMIIGWVLVAVIVLPIAMCSMGFVGSRVQSGAERARNQLEQTTP